MISKIFVGSDHAGFALKKDLLKSLETHFPNLKFEDLGCPSEASTDYPKYAELVGKEVAKTPNAGGLLICGSGIGMCIAANKIKGIRAASVWDATSARLSRQHNDSNILCLGARLTGKEVALEAARVWLTTDFEKGRHGQRVDLITEIEK